MQGDEFTVLSSKDSCHVPERVRRHLSVVFAIVENAVVVTLIHGFLRVKSLCAVTPVVLRRAPIAAIATVSGYLIPFNGDVPSQDQN